MSPISRKPIDLPPSVAQRFMVDMWAYFAETDPLKRDEIAARQLHVLNDYRSQREPRLRLSDIKEMFAQVRDHLGEDRPKTSPRKRR
ncbi:hypothetical protein ACFFWD_36900 [Bradyrhizobium erythrophlei]|uniref:hypothetical protein n=1 Tax=Bradyrhizobium erythrophlei TaxID=1437360 RepID=UPI0035E708BC